MNRFVGIDISPAMLKIAENDPPFKSEITINKIELINVDFLKLNDIGNFDFIYSIGVIGEHIPFNKKVVSKVQEFLKPNGIFVFTCVCWFHRSFKRRVINQLFEILGDPISDIGCKMKVYKNFFVHDSLIIKLLNNYFEILDFRIWNTKYPHYLVSAKKRFIK